MMKRRNSSSARALGVTTSSPSKGVYRGRIASSIDLDTAAEEIDLLVSNDAVAVEPVGKSAQAKADPLFRGAFAAMREIVWDHRDKSVVFVMADGRASISFIFPALHQLEAQISAVLATADVNRQPKQAYVGVLVGHSPSSPIQQRRRVSVTSNIGITSQAERATDQATAQSTILTGTKRRELLEHERPLRSAASRERLAIDFFRTGYLSFSCSISRDRRGLKLDAFFLSVFPSPDCHDRSACLFSYPFDRLESCRAIETRLEFRFKRAEGSGAVKQPTYLVFQSSEAQLIREAVWYLKYGSYREVSTRERAAKPAQAQVSDRTPASNPSGASTSSYSSVTNSQQAGGLRSCANEEALNHRIESRCRMIGCHLRCESTPFLKSSSPSITSVFNVTLASTPESHQSMQGMQTTSPAAPASMRAISSSAVHAGLGCLCDEHAAMLCGSPSNRPNQLKRGGSSGFFSRKERASRVVAHAMVSLVQAGHFARTLKYHGSLFKKPGSGAGSNKYQVSRAWSQKVAVVIETPVGGFLCYYDKLSHCPGMTDTPKERRVIDLSSVLCIRAESLFGGASSPAASAGVNGAGGPCSGSCAFDIITLYRTWTFAATDAEEYETWLHVLSELVEKHAAAAPDKPIRYPVRVALPTDAARSTTRTEEAVLEISAHGLCVLGAACSGSSQPSGAAGGHNDYGGQVLLAWYFTDIQKWSVVAHQGEKCCLLSCLSPAEKEARDQRPALSSALSAPVIQTVPRASGTSSGSGRCESFLLQTPEAGVICDVIEFYVGKCIAKLEVLTIEFMERYAKEREASSAEAAAKRTLSMTLRLSMTQPEAVERPKSEKIVSKLMESGENGFVVSLAKLYASGPKFKETVVTEEHSVHPVSLAPIAYQTVIPPATSDIPASIQPTEISPTSPVPELIELLVSRGGISSDTAVNSVPSQTTPAVSARSEESSRVTASTAAGREMVSKEPVDGLAADAPVELDMIECILSEDGANRPPDRSAVDAEPITDVPASSQGRIDAEPREQHRNDDGDESGEEPDLFPVNDHEPDVPLLEPSSSQVELRLDESNTEPLANVGVLDLSCFVSDPIGMCDGGWEGDDSVRVGEEEVRDGEENEELDRFESFDYCICHVDGAAPTDGPGDD